MKSTTKLRELIQRKEILVAPGAFDALSAKLIEAVGFEAVYMTGFGTAASIFGVPDIGLLTMTEMVENAKRISDAVKVPVFDALEWLVAMSSHVPDKGEQMVRYYGVL